MHFSHALDVCFHFSLTHEDVIEMSTLHSRNSSC